jgi:beta-glucanase (GH16 family)
VSINKAKTVFSLPVLALILFACRFLVSSPPPRPENIKPKSPEVGIVQTETAVQTRKIDASVYSWPMIFHDEFDGSQLNQSVWADEYLWGRTNPPELQYYAHDAFRQNNGVLSIMAEKKVIQGMNYSSGVITSFDSFIFTYGYVEARVRIPSGQGFWPALWLLDAGGKVEEIDVAEFLGQDPNVAHMTFHYTDQQGQRQETGSSYQGPDFSQDYHVLGLDWNSTAITWYIDGVECYRIDHNIPNTPMYLIANLAVGGSWPGSPDNTTRFPATFDIDYIRVFQR